MVVPGLSDLGMINISVEFLVKIQPTPGMCWGGLNDWSQSSVYGEAGEWNLAI